MNITLNITGATAAEIKQAVQELSESFAINIKGEMMELKNEKVEVVEKVKEPKKTTPKEVEKVEKETEAVPATETTLEQVRASVQAKATSGKRLEVKALLTEFGAENVTALPKEMYFDFLTEVNAL